MGMEPSRLNTQSTRQAQGVQVAQGVQNAVNEGTVQQNGASAASPTDLVHRKVNASTLLDIGANYKINVEHLNFFYGKKQALFDVALPIRERQVTALIGPSGCGKSTFLRTLNRMNDLIVGTRTEGQAMLNGRNIYDRKEDVVALRHLAEPAHGHVVDQALAKRADGTNHNELVHRSTPLLKEPRRSDHCSYCSIRQRMNLRAYVIARTDPAQRVRAPTHSGHWETYLRSDGLASMFMTPASCRVMTVAPMHL